MSEIEKGKYYLDIAPIGRNKTAIISFPERKKIIKNSQFYKTGSTLFSNGRQTRSFFTEDSGLYLLPQESKLINEGVILQNDIKKLDGLSARIVRNYQAYRPGESDTLYKKLVKQYEKVSSEFERNTRSFASWIKSPVQIWNFSIVGAILLGMISMTFIYRYLGQGVSAGNIQSTGQVNTSVAIESKTNELIAHSLVLGSETYSGAAADKDEDDETNYILKAIRDLEDTKKEEFEGEIREMVKGHPIEKMIPHILKKDKIVAAFLVGIAKKESNWGTRVPLLRGQDCYNYWGYKGKRKLMGTGGHTCFNSRKDAVDTVAKRIEWLIENKKLDTPAKMVIWKCGSECYKDNPAAVRKWISDVEMYFEKLND